MQDHKPAVPTLTRRRFLLQGSKFAAAFLVASYPVLIERYLILTNLYRITVPNLPAAFSGFRLVHLTDLHYGPLVPLEVIRWVINRANGLQADLIVCTGDYVHGSHSAARIDTVWELLAQLRAPFGVYSVLGNHDHWADTDRSLLCLHASGQDLRHRTRLITRDGAKLRLAGAGDLLEDHRDLDSILDGIAEEECRIMLAHNPDTADTNFSARVDLMLCGHTHGGQVVVPFVGPPVLPVHNKNYSSGIKTSSRGTKLFISRGIGWAIYPIRFNCPPEIALLELVPDAPAQPEIKA